jgi:ubiquinone/menaquinone biosynthesis C-methylase UbiE
MTTATETARKRYNRAARFYDVEQAIGERLVFRRLRRQLWAKAPATGSILEVGVGTGVNIAYYPGGAHVTAIDISERMLARATRSASTSRTPRSMRSWPPAYSAPCPIP